jgi:hypothetical protein
LVQDAASQGVWGTGSWRHHHNSDRNWPVPLAGIEFEFTQRNLKLFRALDGQRGPTRTFPRMGGCGRVRVYLLVKVDIGVDPDSWEP